MHKDTYAVHEQGEESIYEKENCRINHGRPLIFGKKTAQSLKNKALCRSVYIGYTALFFKLKKFF